MAATVAEYEVHLQNKTSTTRSEVAVSFPFSGEIREYQSSTLCNCDHVSNTDTLFWLTATGSWHSWHLAYLHLFRARLCNVTDATNYALRDSFVATTVADRSSRTTRLRSSEEALLAHTS
jgi:hypothetical protein